MRFFIVFTDFFLCCAKRLRSLFLFICLRECFFIKSVRFDGRKSYYRYSDPSFSIFNNELTAEEVASPRSTIDLLSRFRGVPSNAWLEDVISNLEFRFGVKPNTENIVSFEHNDLLKGTEFLGELIESALNHQPLNLLYRTFAGKER